MGNWQVTGRLKTGFAAVAGAVVVSLVAPAVAEATAAKEDSSAPNDSASRSATGVQAKQQNASSTPADSPARQSSAWPSPSPGSRSGSGVTSKTKFLDQKPRYRIVNGQRVEMPAGSFAWTPSAGYAKDLGDLAKLIYLFWPTRTAPGPAGTQADALALGNALARHWKGHLEQIRDLSDDPDAAVAEFVRNEWQKFQADPARYVDELRGQLAITAAATAAETAAEAATAAEAVTSVAGPARPDSHQVSSAEPASRQITSTQTESDQGRSVAAPPASAKAITVGDRVAARASGDAAPRTAEPGAAEQVSRDVEAAGGTVWGTKITPDTAAGAHARPDVFDRLPKGQPAAAKVQHGPGAAHTPDHKTRT